MDLSDINEAIVRSGAGSAEVFRRGESYWRNGAVDGLAQRGNVLRAAVQGSQYERYDVAVTLGENRIESAHCSCPYSDERDGWCKHIVAVLLAAIEDPGAIDEEEPLPDLLEPLDRDALKSILVTLAEQDPGLGDRIAELAERAAFTAAVPAPPPARSAMPERVVASFPPVDTAAIRRRVRSAIRQVERMSGSEAYWHVGSIVREICDGPIQEAGTRLAAGDAAGALAMVDAVVDAYMEDWEMLDGSDGETPDPFNAAGQVAAEALLTLDEAGGLSATERRKWLTKLREWQESIDGYGVEDAFPAAIAAAEHGWSSPIVQRLLNGEAEAEDPESPEDDEYDEDGDAGGVLELLGDALVNILERRGRQDDALRLALAAGRLPRAASLLLQLGRAAEAVKITETRARGDHATILDIARTLAAAGADDIALEVAERGLGHEPPSDGRSYGRVALALWLRDAAEAADQPERARPAARIALREGPDLSGWLHAERLFGPAEWPGLRDELLTGLRGRVDADTYVPSDVTLIFLHEGQIDDAIRSVRHGVSGGLFAQVADAAIEAGRAADVLDRCRREAEIIMDAGKAGHYVEARDWLARYRRGLQSLNRSAEWHPYRDSVLNKHQRKYKLVPLIRSLG
jgi:uncharacterized Zn finger protein